MSFLPSFLQFLLSLSFVSVCSDSFNISWPFQFISFPFCPFLPPPPLSSGTKTQEEKGWLPLTLLTSSSPPASPVTSIFHICSFWFICFGLVGSPCFYSCLQGYSHRNILYLRGSVILSVVMHWHAKVSVTANRGVKDINSETAHFFMGQDYIFTACIVYKQQKR